MQKRGACLWCPEIEGGIPCSCECYRPIHGAGSRCRCGHGEVWHQNGTTFRRKLEDGMSRGGQGPLSPLVTSLQLHQGRLEAELAKTKGEVLVLVNEISELRRKQREEVRRGGKGVDGLDEPEDKKCIICMERVRDTVLLPCRHAQFCRFCAARVSSARRPKCPLCRGKVDCFLELLL